MSAPTAPVAGPVRGVTKTRSAPRLDAVAYLEGLKNYESSGHLAGPTLERVTALVSELGDPHRAYPVIHVTGTNGKSSTAAMIGALLAGRGLRVGTYTSPHIDQLTERVTVAGRPVAAVDLHDAIRRVERAAGHIGVTPTWFEAMTAAGLLLLADREVDVAVVEVGMLGRWDATNVVDGAVAVVTNVQLDHTDMAGPTRAAIAYEKAGIVKAGATLILGEPDPALRSHFTRRDPARILTAGSELTWENRRRVGPEALVDLVNPWGRHEDVGIGMAGVHQAGNALLALSAAEAFTGAAIPVAAITAALADTRLPGRFEIVHTNPTVILDGAHNPAAASALRQSVDELFGETTPKVLLYGSLAGRDPIEFLEQVGVHDADLVITTEPSSPRAVRAPILAGAARTFGVPARSVADPARALDAALAAAGTSGVVIATGSLYLIGSLRAAAARR